MTDPPPTGAYDFGPFHYDPARRLLLRAGQVVPLEPKILDTLEVLLERRGEVVEKADLIRRIWPDCTVEDVGLARNISILRRALDDEGGAYIHTVPKRGYRFAAGIEPAATAASEPPSAPSRARPWMAVGAGLILLAVVVYWQFYLPSRYLPKTGHAAVVAVVPPECITPELGRSAFSSGFSSALVSEMARLEHVQLISPSTVNRYRRFGIPTAVMTRVLGAHVVVEGTAELSGNRLQISLRMSDVHSGRLIWAEVFDGGASDLARFQSDVARDAAAHISPLLGSTR